MEKIIIYATWWCGGAKRALKILDNREIDYEWIDIDKDPEGDKFVKDTNNGNRSVPTILFPDQSVLVEPSAIKLNEKLDSLNL